MQVQLGVFGQLSGINKSRGNVLELVSLCCKMELGVFGHFSGVRVFAQLSGISQLGLLDGGNRVLRWSSLIIVKSRLRRKTKLLNKCKK